MNYHNILHDNMLNGEGLRVVLFVSGCDRKCCGCQNPETWSRTSGIPFGMDEVKEIATELEHPYTSGLTLVGGEPLLDCNVSVLTELCKQVKDTYPNKTIWCYTGYLYEEVKDLEIMKYIDVLLDGPFIQELADVNAKWVGSTNQRVIDVKKSREMGSIVLYK